MTVNCTSLKGFTTALTCELKYIMKLAQLYHPSFQPFKLDKGNKEANFKRE